MLEYSNRTGPHVNLLNVGCPAMESSRKSSRELFLLDGIDSNIVMEVEQ